MVILEGTCLYVELPKWVSKELLTRVNIFVDLVNYRDSRKKVIIPIIILQDSDWLKLFWTEESYQVSQKSVLPNGVPTNGFRDGL